ncbi:MAG: helix-turn-helix transcriptional regulator, partial [Nanoarchaeota archaeon]
DTSKKQNELLRDLENNISLAFEKYNKYLIDLYRVVSEIKENKTTYVSRAQTSSDVYSRPETRLDDQKMIEERKNEEYIYRKEEKEEQNKESKPPLEHYSDILTRSEKNILGELCNTSQKLSYKDIAVMTGVSSNTVKNHICHIKAKGFPIQEINDGNGIKRYYVSDNIRKVLLSKTI